MSVSTPPDPREVEAFESEMLKHLPDVVRFARSLTKDPADADDVVQETYLRAFRARHTFIPGSDGRRWLFTIARNLFLRGRERESRTVALEGEPELDAVATVQAQVTARSAGVDPRLDHPDLAPAIAKAIADLPEPFRLVVALVDVAGLDYAEAAEQLGIPIGTVRSRLFRARRTLQEQLLDHARDAGFRVGAPTEAP
ncbi:MAG: RNA polymerase sigma factor [Gemmatimonadaceae bacterium]|jgi:RNA polymerase sigma-70 factor (ECF subfamily)|nr:RNA polymerase sigma factor [Gemmatimonadaceae bacterium]